MALQSAPYTGINKLDSTEFGDIFLCFAIETFIINRLYNKFKRNLNEPPYKKQERILR
jgi:hypothetical protein